MRILPVIVHFLIRLINALDNILQLMGIVLYPITKENVLKDVLRLHMYLRF